MVVEVIKVRIRLAQGPLDLGDVDARKEAEEQQEQHQEHADRANKENDLIGAGAVVFPITWQPHTSQGGANDHEALEPHADVNAHRYRHDHP